MCTCTFPSLVFCHNCHNPSNSNVMLRAINTECAVLENIYTPPHRNMDCTFLGVRVSVDQKLFQKDVQSSIRISRWYKSVGEAWIFSETTQWSFTMNFPNARLLPLDIFGKIHLIKKNIYKLHCYIKDCWF